MEPTNNTPQNGNPKPFPDWIPNPGEKLTPEQKEWIEQVVTNQPLDDLKIMYCGTCIVDQYARIKIQEQHGVTIPTQLRPQFTPEKPRKARKTKKAKAPKKAKKPKAKRPSDSASDSSAS